MALSDSPLIPADGVMVITDNTGTPLSFTVVYEDGDLKAGDFKHSMREKVAFKDREATYSIRDGDYEDINFEFTCHAVGWGDSTGVGISDVVMKTGTVWGAGVSMISAARGGAWAVKIVWTGERTNYGGTADVTLTMKYCTLSEGFQEGYPGKFMIKGVAHVMAHDASASIVLA